MIKGNDNKLRDIDRKLQEIEGNDVSHPVERRSMAADE